MKTLPLVLLACIAAAFGAYAAAPTAQSPAGIALRHVTAADAFSAIQQQLGTNAADAVSLVDEQRNAITLDPAHAQAAIVRAFLAGLDHQPPLVRVDATITRRVDATATSPARIEESSLAAALAPGGQPGVFNIPGEHGSTQIELRVKPVAK